MASLIGKGLNFHPNLMVFYKLGPILDLFRIGLLLRDFSERHDGRRVTRRGCAETFKSGVLYFENIRPLPLGLPSFTRMWIKVEHGFLLDQP